MFAHPYICLDSKIDLPDRAVMSWMRAVLESGPPGISATEQPEANAPQIRFYMRRSNGTNHYVAVLARNLSGNEATLVAKHYNSAQPDGDFVVHWSQEPIEDDTNAKLESDMLSSLVLEAAKLNHNDWYRRKVEQGWRYGQRHDGFSKTSPTCKDWDSLPDQYKDAELRRMSSLVRVLDRMNLKITKK